MDTTQHTVLIVEDETALRTILKDRLLDEEFHVLEAKNGKEGLEVAKKEHPDLVLLDIVMPEMDGIAMLKELRKDAWGETARVLILSNLSAGNKDVLKGLIENKPIFFLVKSDWKIGDVVNHIREILP